MLYRSEADRKAVKTGEHENKKGACIQAFGLSLSSAAGQDSSMVTTVQGPLLLPQSLLSAEIPITGKEHAPNPSADPIDCIRV